MSLRLIPIMQKEANAFIAKYHRHHKPPQGCRFCTAVSDGSEIVGVAIAGRPVSRALDDGATLEITRVCTNGFRNASSKLYGACCRAGFALGYTRIVTYTITSESGVSLRASGFRCIGQAGGGSWNRPNRKRVDKHPTESKIRWELAS